MASQQGTLRMHRDARTCTFQVDGLARVDQGLALRKAAEQALTEGTACLRIDLRRCTFMDSTFMGTLLYLKRASDRRGDGDFTLVCPSAPCSRLLQQMGLDCFCKIVIAEEPSAAAWQEPVHAPHDVDTFKRHVVQAHEELASIEGPAGEPFRDVMRCLNKDLAKNDGPRP